MSDNFNPYYLSFFREGITALIVIVLIVLNIITWKKPSKKDLLWNIGMGVISGVGNIFMYYCFVLLPLGFASFLTYSSIVLFGNFLGSLIYKEKFTKEKFIASIIVLIGIVLMFDLSSRNTLNIVGVTTGILFGLSITLFGVVSKKVSQNYNPLQIYMISCIVTSILSLVVSLSINEIKPNFTDLNSLTWAFIFSVAALFSNGFYILGFKNKIDLSIVSIIMPLESVIAAITGYIFFHETITIRTFLGGALIIISSSIPYFLQVLQNKNK